MNKRQKEVQQVYLDNEKEVLRELTHAYNDSLAQINQKIELLMARQDADMQHVIYQIEHQKALKTQVQSILEQLQAKEFDTVSEFLANSYTDGFVGTMYDMHGQGVPLIVPIDQKQVLDAIKHDTKLSENLYTSLGKDIKVLNKQIAGEISRGIASGQGYMEIARNIENYANIPKNKAMRIARTESHRIQCKSTLDAQYKAKEKGADVVKQWNAALDSVTRKSHRKLDGQIRELDEPFEVDGHKAMHPSGFGRPEEDINCRCALLQRAKWALDDEELEKLKDRAAYYELDKSDDFKEFEKKYLKAAEKESVLDNVQKKNIDDVPAKEAVDKKEFVPAKTIEEAQEYAKGIGVKYPVYEKLPLDTANELNKAVLNLPEDARPIFTGDSTTLEQYFGGTGYKLPRKSTQFYGVTLEDMDGVHLGYGNGYDFDTHGSMVGISSSYKSIDKISKKKEEYQATYREKYGKDAFYNVNGKATIHHEIGHCYQNKYGLPDGFEKDAERWAKEANCKILEKPSEAFSEAWGAYYSGTKELPDYIEKYMKELENIGNSGIIEIDELTPCLRRMSDNKIIDTSVVDVSPTKEDFKDWEFDWTIPQKNGYTIRGIKADGDDRIQGMVAMKSDPQNYAINVDIVEAAPFNNPHNKIYVEKEYSGIGGHLFAEAVKESMAQGYDGYVYFKAKTDLIEHYQKELGAVLINPKERIMAIDERSAKVLYDKYYKDE